MKNKTGCSWVWDTEADKIQAEEFEKRIRKETTKEIIEKIEKAMGLEDCDKYCERVPKVIDKLKNKFLKINSQKRWVKRKFGVWRYKR